MGVRLDCGRRMLDEIAGEEQEHRTPLGLARDVAGSSTPVVPSMVAASPDRVPVAAKVGESGSIGMG